MFRRYKITSAPRFITFLTVLILLALFLFLSLSGTGSARGLSEPEYIRVYVSAGDTIWDIASQYGPQDTDIRRTVYEICRLNGTQAGDIREGDLLLVPVMTA